MQERLPKFTRREDAFARKRTTAADVALVRLVASYRFLPTSLVVRLASFSANTVNRHLQSLFHQGLLNRFSFPRLGNPGEFHYYVDSPAALALVDNDDRDLAAEV